MLQDLLISFFLFSVILVHLNHKRVSTSRELMEKKPTHLPYGWKSQILFFSKSGRAGSSKTSSQTCVRPRRAGGWWGCRYSTNHLSSTSPLDTHHLESPSEPDTDDTFSGQGISRMDLIHHPALTDKNPLAENTTARAAGEKRFNSRDSRRTISL